VDRLPVYVREDALVVSDNADLYGTLADLFERAVAQQVSAPGGG
jgi:hypothetical protein